MPFGREKGGGVLVRKFAEEVRSRITVDAIVAVSIFTVGLIIQGLWVAGGMSTRLDMHTAEITALSGKVDFVGNEVFDLKGKVVELNGKVLELDIRVEQIQGEQSRVAKELKDHIDLTNRHYMTMGAQQRN
jgi:hypothetical protein